MLERLPKHPSTKEMPGKPKHARKKTAKERVRNAVEYTAIWISGMATVAALQAGVSEVVNKTPIWPSFNPYRHSLQLSYNPCTYISPLDTDRTPVMKEVAKECIKDEKHGEVVVVDFIGLGKARDAELAEDTHKLLSIATAGILNEKVTVLPASDTAGVLYRLFSPSRFLGIGNCDPDPNQYNSPVAFALETMPEIQREHPDATVISLTPQTVCNEGGDAFTGTNTAEVFQDGWTLKEGLVIQSAANIVHEDLHNKFWGHDGTVSFRSVKYGLSDGYAQLTIGLPGSSYREYNGKNNIMGDLPNPWKQVPNYAQIDDLYAPYALLYGEGVLRARPIGTRWRTLTTQDIQNGDYALIPLKKPVTLHGYMGDQIPFNDFLILPTVAYNTSDPYAFPTISFWPELYDNVYTHNTAIGTNPLSHYAMGLGGSQVLSIDGQKVMMKVTEQGVAFRQLANS